MLEKIKQQINEIKIILEGLKNQKEDIDKYLKENKYAKKITEKFFKNDQQIISEIKKNKELITELKHNHIKLTESQKEKEKSHKQYIEELNKTLNSTLKLLKKLELEKTYIDQEIIDILNLNEIEDLKDIIEFNKTILLKKKGFIQKEEIEEAPEEKKEIKIESKQTENKKETLKPTKEEKIEKILLYNSLEELNDHLKKQYNIEIETERNIEELNKIIEIIENSSIKEIDNSLIKDILEKCEMYQLRTMKEALEENEIEAKDIVHIKDIFLYCEKNQRIAEYITRYKDLKKEQKLNLLNKSEAKREKYVRNKNAMLSYGLFIKNNNALLAEISIEKLDQMIELGHYNELVYIASLYNTKSKLVENIQFEDYMAQKRYPNLYNYFFEGTIYNHITEIDEKKYDMTRSIEIINNEIKKDKKYKSKLIMGMPDLKQLTSRNEILKRETEISKRSFDNFLLTIFPHEVKDANIIYGEKNKYLELIEEKFSSKKSISYGIKIRKDFARAGLIQISKPKVLRLLNEHLYEEHEITKDIVKQCMLYNLITTDEILNELDRILTEEFELLDQKIKKY